MRLRSSAFIIETVLRTRAVSEGVEAVADELALEARSIAYAEAFDGGEYAAKIDRQPSAKPGASKVVARDRKSRWLEEGTGIYGPRKRPIVPKHGKFLVFRVPKGAPKGSMSGTRKPGDLVFAKSVKGRPASHVMERAAKEVASKPGRRWRPSSRLS